MKHLNLSLPNGTEPKLTAEELQLLEHIARLHGIRWVEKNWRLILAQARELGEIG